MLLNKTNSLNKTRQPDEVDKNATTLETKDAI